MADISYSGGRPPVWKRAFNKCAVSPEPQLPQGQRRLGDYQPQVQAYRRPSRTNTTT